MLRSRDVILFKEFNKDYWHEKDISVSCQALHNLLHKFRDKFTVENLPRKRRPRKITEENKRYYLSSNPL